MRILFMGEPENLINVSSHNARALRTFGVKATFDTNAYWSSRQWHRTCLNVDLIHLISYSHNDPWLLRKIAIARTLGTPVIRMWVGSDVLWAIRYAPATRFARAIQSLGVEQVTVADHLASELAEIGIQAATLPIIAEFTAPAAPPLPDRPTVLAYLPGDDRREFYGGHIVDALIRRRPDVRFLIANDLNTDYSSWPNVESVGLIDDMTSIYARTTVLVRPTAHDGMPRMMLEALSHGRHAVCSYPYPHCHRATNVQSFADALDDLLANPTLNEAGRQFVTDHFDRAQATQMLLSLCEKRSRFPRPLRALAGAARTLRTLASHWSTCRGSEYRSLPADEWQRIIKKAAPPTLELCQMI